MAVVTGRALLVLDNNALYDYFQVHWDADFHKYSAMYANSSMCEIDYNKLMQPDMKWCKGAGPMGKIALYASDDYDVPLLQVNPVLQGKLQHLFPDGSIFHRVARHLFSPTQQVINNLQPFAPLAKQCAVGMHIRIHKTFGGIVPAQGAVQQFTKIAQGVLQQHQGTVFVAADSPVFAEVASRLPDRRVWWSNLTQNSIKQRLSHGNPGTDLSAIVDMFLLCQCKNIIISSGSTFGAVSAALADVVPVYAVRGNHDSPYAAPWFWKAINSEPIFYKLSAKMRKHLNNATVKALQTHPFLYQLEQGHP